MSPRSFVRGRAAVLAAAWAWGCSPSAPPLEIAVRFVDPAQRAGASYEPSTRLVAPPPRAFGGAAAPDTLSDTIGGETRPVLTAPAREVALPMTKVAVADASVGPTLHFGEPLRASGRLVLMPSLRTPKGWLELGQILVTLPEGGESFELNLDVPPQLADANDEVPLVVRAIAADAEPRTTYRTAEIAVPSGALMQFSVGMLHGVAGQASTRFSVEACDADACDPIFESDLDPAAGGRRWHEFRLPLGPHAGVHRSFRFTTASEPGYAMPVWGDPQILVPRSGADARSNLVLISIDTLRADHLGLYGYERDTSPQLDRLAARRAAVFDAFTAASTHTGPSHMTLFTSLPPSVHGVRGHLTSLTAAVHTLPEVLREAGYATAAFTGGGPLNPDLGFGRGFDLYAVDPGETVLEHSQTERMAERAVGWLRAHDERPFFLFLHTFQVHTPYAPPPRYASLFADSERAARAAAKTPERRRAIEHAANYDREIRHVDDVLGQLFGELEARGLSRDTFVVVLSDHGEEFREHGLMGHATLPFQSVLHVPLIVFGPGIAARRIAAPVAHEDLMPTLLELLGVELDADARRALRGRSFAGLLTARGGGDEAEREAPLISEAWELPDGYRAPSLAVRSGRWKLIRAQSANGRQQVLFDLSADPQEQRPLPLNNAAAGALADALDTYQGEVDALGSTLRGGAPPGGEIAPSPEADQRLRELGYVE